MNGFSAVIAEFTTKRRLVQCDTDNEDVFECKGTVYAALSCSLLCLMGVIGAFV